MKLKLKYVIALMLVFIQANIIMANGGLNSTGEEICLAQVKANDDNNNWTYKRSPQICPLQLFIEDNKLHFFGGDVPVTSRVRIYESVKETDCASFCIDIASHEEVSLPETLAGGNYTIIITVCNNIYKGFFELQ